MEDDYSIFDLEVKIFTFNHSNQLSTFANFLYGIGDFSELSELEKHIKETFEI